MYVLYARLQCRSVVNLINTQRYNICIRIRFPPHLWERNPKLFIMHDDLTIYYDNIIFRRGRVEILWINAKILARGTKRKSKSLRGYKFIRKPTRKYIIYLRTDVLAHSHTHTHIRTHSHMGIKENVFKCTFFFQPYFSVTQAKTTYCVTRMQLVAFI
jgi:hypothetical protein